MSKSPTQTQRRRRKQRTTQEPRGQQRRRIAARASAPTVPAPLYRDVVRDLGYDPMPGTS